ncbi:MAG TPA: PilZ domain-containing protein [Syntrophales bacterium]|jgi:hypothetical protein|nr:PilZ domain-containing protein [Syntrophales bacterium]HRT62457.1 PilZ domain-containing protein [Syntrophales bacterium]
MSYQPEESFENRREYSRVEAYVPFDVRVVPPEEHKAVWSRVSGDTTLEFANLPEIEDKVFAEWFKMINAKLDLITSMLSLQKEGFSSLPVHCVTISGGGLGFSSKKKYEMGDILEIRMILNMLRSVALYVYGKIVQVRSQGEDHQVSVKYIAMDDEIREEIIRFVFHRERQIIREKRR